VTILCNTSIHPAGCTCAFHEGERLRAEVARLTEALAKEKAAHELEKRERERDWDGKRKAIERAEAAEAALTRSEEARGEAERAERAAVSLVHEQMAKATARASAAEEKVEGLRTQYDHLATRVLFFCAVTGDGQTPEQAIETHFAHDVKRHSEPLSDHELEETRALLPPDAPRNAGEEAAP
jgi:DNA repair exonuclease SbcCD ATPase subunit